MKNIKKFLGLILLIPSFVDAAGSINVSSSNLSMKVGETKTFTITANNAAGRVDISSTNTSVATVSTSNYFLDMNSVKITVTAKSAGTAKVNVVLTDVATYDSEVISGTKVINITVTNSKTTSNNSSNSSNNASKNNNSSSTSDNTKTVVEEKKEMVIKRFEIVGYDIDFNKNIYEYNISIDKNVSKLYIIIEGENFTAINDKEVDVKNKDEVIVTLKGETETQNYKINLNKKDIVESSCSEETIKDTCVENKIILYAMIFFELLSFILLLMLIKIKRKINIHK